MRGCFVKREDCKCYAVVRINNKTGRKQDIDYFCSIDDANEFRDRIINEELDPEETVLKIEEIKEKLC